MNVPTARAAPKRTGGERWKFSDLLADADVRERWEKVRRYFFLRESTYDMTNRCNIRCEGCLPVDGQRIDDHAALFRSSGKFPPLLSSAA